MFRKVCGVLSMWICVCGCDNAASTPVDSPIAVHVTPAPILNEPEASKAPEFDVTQEPDTDAESDKEPETAMWRWRYAHPSYQGLSGPSHISTLSNAQGIVKTSCQFKADATQILCMQWPQIRALPTTFEIDVPEPIAHKPSQSCWGDYSTREIAPPGHGSGGMLERDGVLYVVYHSTQASGASLFAHDLTTQRTLWEVHLTAIGGGDSEDYQNHVQLDLDEARQQLVIYGRESEGGYVELRGLEDGVLRGHHYKSKKPVNAKELNLPTTRTLDRTLRTIAGLTMKLAPQPEEGEPLMHDLTISEKGWTHTLPVYKGMVDVQQEDTEALTISLMKDARTLTLIKVERSTGDMYHDTQITIPQSLMAPKEYIHMVELLRDDEDISGDMYVDLHIKDERAKNKKTHRMVISIRDEIEAVHTWYLTEGQTQQTR